MAAARDGREPARDGAQRADRGDQRHVDAQRGGAEHDVGAGVDGVHGEAAQQVRHADEPRASVGDGMARNGNGSGLREGRRPGRAEKRNRCGHAKASLSVETLPAGILSTVDALDDGNAYVIPAVGWNAARILTSARGDRQCLATGTTIQHVAWQHRATPARRL